MTQKLNESRWEVYGCQGILDTFFFGKGTYPAVAWLVLLGKPSDFGFPEGTFRRPGVLLAGASFIQTAGDCSLGVAYLLPVAQWFSFFSFVFGERFPFNLNQPKKGCPFFWPWKSTGHLRLLPGAPLARLGRLARVAPLEMKALRSQAIPRPSVMVFNSKTKGSHWSHRAVGQKWGNPKMGCPGKW